MISFFTGLSLKSWLIIGAVVGTLAFIAAVYAKGRSDQAAKAAIGQQAKTIEILRDRSKTDAEINGADNRALCASLGGVWDSASGQCL